MRLSRRSRKGNYVVGTKFDSPDRLFQAETGIATKSGPYGPYVYLSDKDVIEIALRWQEVRKSLIFLRDLLDFSLALDQLCRGCNIYKNGSGRTRGQGER
jgi:hypothetical protein